MEFFVSAIVQVVLVWFHVPICARFVSKQVLHMIVIFEVQLWEWKKTDFRGFAEPVVRNDMNATALSTSALSK
jgi:hypothetical protein